MFLQKMVFESFDECCSSKEQHYIAVHIIGPFFIACYDSCQTIIPTLYWYIGNTIY